MHDTGKILLGLAAFAGLVTAPVWYAVGRGKGAPPELERPADAKQCIEPTAFMRARHRGEHVYVATDGKQHEMKLTGTCLGCHADPGKFCDRCHQYAAVEVFCWDCHRQKRRGS
jgi:hypothetical protein